jgi:hypothetical protein
MRSACESRRRVSSARDSGCSRNLVTGLDIAEFAISVIGILPIDKVCY